jgi:WD40 repeat protein
VVHVPGQPLPASFGKVTQTFRAGGGAVTGLAFPNQGAFFYTSSADKSVRLWKLSSESAVRNFAHGNSVNAVAFNPAGTQLATACSDGRLRLFDVAKGALVRQIVAHNTPNLTAIYCVAWSKDGKQVVTGSQDQSLKLWDATTGNLVKEFKAYKEKAFEKGHQEAVLSVAFTPDGKQIVSGGMDKAIKVWNIADGSVARDLVNPAFKPTAHPGWVYAVRFSKDGKHLYSVGGAPRLKGYLARWDLAKGKLEWGKELAQGTLFALALSPDGKYLALGSGGSVRTPEYNLGVVLKLPLGKKKEKKEE